ncbi:discoidin domain-containing protein (plasmid) [Streptosporangium sp. CA-135522]|uniref:discoidin domain-containing protein n=1 Tax=Streptosporangium sp. CA-135522 TaxID=3240072 RepID=UPI003D8F838A
MARGDWVVHPVTQPSTITVGSDQITMANGIVARAFDLRQGGMTTTSLRNLQTGQEMLHHAGEPEARITLDGVAYAVGGPGVASGFAYHSHLVEDSTQKPYEWTPYEKDGTTLKPYATVRPWPAKGKALVVTFKPVASLPAKLQTLTVTVRYEIYDGIATVMKKVSVDNTGATAVMIDALTVDVLHVKAELKDRLYIDTDFHGGRGNAYRNNDKDRTYTAVDASEYRTYTLLHKVGPAYRIGTQIPHWGGHFDGFRSFLLLHGTGHYEAQQMEIKAMYRTIAPQITENPLFYHLISDNATALRASAQAADAMGFEMMIQSFGSGFNMLSTDPNYLNRKKGDFDAIRGTGLDVGGYVLLTTGQILDPAQSSCAGTGWGTVMGMATTGFQEFLRRIRTTVETTSMDVIEVDGPWPLFRCNETNHAFMDGGDDSIYKQWVFSNELYRYLRGKGLYINAPDLHYLNGANKDGIGYEENGWSAPRQQQLMLGRQYVYNGTYEKTPSSTWTFVPISVYHGGGEAAAFAPLKQNLFDYSWVIAQNYLSGVQPFFRGTTLDGGDADVRSVVSYWTDVYKTYRGLVTSDIIHLVPPRQDPANPARAQGIDAFMHARSNGNERALVAVFNQTDQPRTQTLTVPLYYTGMTGLSQPPQPVPGSYLDTKDIPVHGPYPVTERFPKPSWNGSYPAATPTSAKVDVHREGAGTPQKLNIDSNGNAQLEVSLAPMSFSWYVVTPNGVEPAAAPAKPAALPDFGGAELKGTPFGSPDADTEPGDTSMAAAFDGKLDTFYDGLDTGSYVGLDLGKEVKAKRIELHPRVGQGGLMQGGKIQGSNTRDSGYRELLKISHVPGDGWQNLALANDGSYRYYRYIGGSGKTSVAEIKLFTDALPPGPQPLDQLIGSPFGTGGTSAAAAFDGDVTTSFKGQDTTAAVGLDLGAGNTKVLKRLRYHPDGVQPQATGGARIQGSNTSSTAGFVDLYTIPGNPAATWHEAVLDSQTAYRYYRYVGGTGNTSVGELQLLAGSDDLVQATGTTFGTDTWATQPGDTTFRAAFDGQSNTFFDGRSYNGAFAGLDLGLGNGRVLKAVRHHPRSNQLERLTNAVVQGSNTSATSGYVDLYNIGAEPRAGWHSALVNNTNAYRWYRVLKRDGLLNLAEMQFFVEPRNLALGRTTSASATTAGSPAAAVDGKASTGWRADGSAEAWLSIDLGSAQQFDKVRVAWGSAWAKDYQVQTSSDGITWTTQRLVFQTGQGESELTELPAPVTARYVRVRATSSAQSPPGYDIREVRVLQ